MKQMRLVFSPLALVVLTVAGNAAACDKDHGSCGFNSRHSDCREENHAPAS